MRKKCCLVPKINFLTTANQWSAPRKWPVRWQSKSHPFRWFFGLRVVGGHTDYCAYSQLRLLDGKTWETSSECILKRRFLELGVLGIQKSTGFWLQNQKYEDHNELVMKNCTNYRSLLGKTSRHRKCANPGEKDCVKVKLAMHPECVKAPRMRQGVQKRVKVQKDSSLQVI